jgi:hypothetical protein
VLKVSNNRLWDNAEPAAVLNIEVKALGFSTYTDEDQLSHYEAVELELHGFLFSVRTYVGFPAKTCSIYFPMVSNRPGKRSLENSTFLVSHIVTELGLSQSDIGWHRAEDVNKLRSYRRAGGTEGAGFSN